MTRVENVKERYSIKQSLLISGFVSLGVAALAVFFPFVSVPILGTISYFKNAQGDGVIIIVLAIIGAVFWALRKPLGMLLTSLGSLGIFIFDVVNFLIKREQMVAELEKQLEGNPFAGLAKVALEGVQIQWGVGVLLVAIVVAIISAVLAIMSKRREIVESELKRRDIEKFLS